LRVREARLDRANEPHDESRRIAIVSRVAGAKTHADEPSFAVEDDKWKVHAMAVVPVEERHRLLTVRRVGGGVDIEHHHAGVVGQLPHVVVLELTLKGDDRPRIDAVLETRERRLRREPALILGQTVTRDPQQRVVAKRVGIVLVFVAESDLKDALAHLLWSAVHDTPRITPIREMRRHSRAHAERRVELTQEQRSAFARNLRRVERDIDAPMRMEIEVGLGQTGRGQHGGLRSRCRNPPNHRADAQIPARAQKSAGPTAAPRE
jgi:hypothetical protein